MATKRSYNKSDTRIEAKKVVTKLMVEEYLASNPDLNLSNFPDDRGANNKVNLQSKEMAKIALDPRQMSIMCATIIGDGTIAIQSGYANARVQYRHSTRQKEWFLWKTLAVFKDYLTEDSIQFQSPDGMQRKAVRLPGELLGKVRVFTSANPTFTELYNIITVKKTKKIQRFWLNHMNSLFLLTLWLDDGSLSGGTPASPGGRQGVIAVNALTMEEAEILANYLKTVWGIECKAVDCATKRTKTNPVSPQIEIADLDNLEKFLRIIAPLIPVKSMIYKVCLCPLEEDRLQRWASEVENLVQPQFQNEVKKIYAYYTIARESEKEKRDSNIPFKIDES